MFSIKSKSRLMSLVCLFFFFFFQTQFKISFQFFVSSEDDLWGFNSTSSSASCSKVPEDAVKPSKS